eukprot:TRINITY_DN1110_c0_g3_i2.p2 TRINITY_DN1110_c0_g3~~TRINITY_DN1110_c0_g3_i2.p2  ORF type:complete len:190 (+),score=44.76 TRINITY_DN1110_c0_g3_i2:559-1128(+)
MQSESYENEKEVLELKIQQLEQELSRSKKTHQCDGCFELRKENEELSQLCADMKNQCLRMELIYNQRIPREEYGHTENIDANQMEKYNQLMEQHKQLLLENEDLNRQLKTEMKTSKVKGVIVDEENKFRQRGMENLRIKLEELAAENERTLEQNMSLKLKYSKDTVELHREKEELARKIEELIKKVTYL